MVTPSLLDSYIVGLLSRYSNIPVGLQYGFLMGLEHYQLINTAIPPNHYKSVEHEQFVLSKYAEEIELGRISPAFPPDQLRRWVGHIRTAPLNVFQQTPGGKLRVTVDHSFPRSALPPPIALADPDVDFTPFDPATHSVNAIIDSKKFQCTWGTFSQCYLMVADAPVGAQAAVYDVDAAFRNVPTHPSACPFLAVQIAGSIHLDHCLNFGASPCPGVWGRIADAMVEVYKANGIDKVIKWVDDFVFFRYPMLFPVNDAPTYPYDESTIWSVADNLGWPWAPKKCFPFATTFTYIGFLWDLVAKTVSLPDAKCAKYLAKLEQWKATFKPTCEEVESLIGTLNHVALIVPAGRTHLLHLYRLRASFTHARHRWIRHKITAAALDDVQWWTQTLQNSFVGMPVIRPPLPNDDALYVDASTDWGIGLLLNGRWLAWKFHDGWRSEGRDIGWAEMVAVELALRSLVAIGRHDTHVIIHSDNQGVVHSVAAGRSRGCQQNAILRHIVHLIQTHKVWVTTTWISTHDNPADPISRGTLPVQGKRLTNRPAIPQHLSPYLSLV